jgi:hypothetical protein
VILVSRARGETKEIPAKLANVVEKGNPMSSNILEEALGAERPPGGKGSAGPEGNAEGNKVAFSMVEG